MPNANNDDIQQINRPVYTTFIGTNGDDAITGTDKRDVLIGGAGDDTLTGVAGSDTFIGGAGADTLISHPHQFSASLNQFVYTAVSDSYYNASGSHSDLIVDFDDERDVLDLTALGLERVGDGRNGDLAVRYDEGEDITYVYSLDKDANGNAFEVRLAGDHSGLNTANFALTYTIEPGGRFPYFQSEKEWHVTGTDGDDVVSTPKYVNTFDGGAGADTVYTSQSRTTVQFDQITDSFVNDAAGTASFDNVYLFKVGSDLLDVSGLGFTGLGDGYNGTLNYSFDAAIDRVVVQSFETDAQGNRFMLHLTTSDRNGVNGLLDVDRFIFAGNETVDRTTATLTGNRYHDHFIAGDEGGVFIGNGWGDYLKGGAGADTFRYLDKSDSLRGNSDLIVNFDTQQDKIDVSALGYTGLGDGTDGTLKLVYDKGNDRTYLKDFDADAQGDRFEIGLEGNFAKTFSADNLVVASAPAVAEAHQAVEVVGVAADHVNGAA
ncbi:MULTISPECIES: M10 family metallopeptidase C-terminal domain-containing protein [unclassified Pseudomonas]|uniref:M10 family metallopeptidase C-terminal domain-containing protein n=1 Tax=unclassified Pseudomonas TaxID=196821 RepID=UPI000BC3AB4B|nr:MULTISPECIES: M10 family metallopeptidase C-terminal domain-containing protein [unclassified Pseudomonas]PVZ12660.1 peptidase M10/serralysin-like protein [Pseudomonas sp. URIL14HWK12:I12]PVZ23189.1 peptidase M10/serralysin-like protein [Pseudomonas sp. URIL14HWK12:I10]PVZ32518.1 peptidase M10/serralysin-like protein [Pseudomonas sp. URIL14HWK12:I11]SNZ13584.1 Hemolysin-type calcium-binding repeat-containing protein [Pseudomonas sp. URIL14HWK12:I9]